MLHEYALNDSLSLGDLSKPNQSFPNSNPAPVPKGLSKSHTNPSPWAHHQPNTPPRFACFQVGTIAWACTRMLGNS